MPGLARFVAWILAIAIIAVTPVPIWLRPVMTADATYERGAAGVLTALLMMVHRSRWPAAPTGAAGMAPVGAVPGAATRSVEHGSRFH
jgi:hypothetical protein